MIWKKIGQIFDPEKDANWNYSYAAVPYLRNIKDGVANIFFTSRNKKNKSIVTSGFFDLNDNFKLLELKDNYGLQLGLPGTFDEDGIMGCQITNVGNQEVLYYQGWNLGHSVPFRNAIGAAIWDNDSKTFKKYSSGPILDRSPFDPCFVATPFVIWINDQYVMYYLSCDSWGSSPSDLHHKYNIKIATSNNGFNWERKGKVAIDYQSEFEYAFSVPRVKIENGIFKMWYSFRGSKENPTYRLGYAESLDGFEWERKDNKLCIDISKEGWDSQMISYPEVFDFKGQRFLLYNGNNYGQTGFGIARLQSEE